MNSVASIVNDKCNGCGICVDICAHQILEVHEEKSRFIPGREEDCIRCGQCVAICPNEAMEQPGITENHYQPLAPVDLMPEQFDAFLASRRSVRNFKDKPVPRETIQRVLDMAARAPMGFPPHTTEALVIASPEEKKHLIRQAREDFAGLIKNMDNPIARFFVRRVTDDQTFNTLKTHVIPIVKVNNQLLDTKEMDRYLYDASAIIVFHSDHLAVSGAENAHIVCTYAMLAAQSLGLGTTVIGLIPPIIQRSKTLRVRYEIPMNHDIHTSLILGYPKYKFKKGVVRTFPNVKFM